MLQYIQRIINARKNEQGASGVEYGLLVAAIAALIVVAAFAIGRMISSAFQTTCTAIDDGVVAVDEASC